MSAAEPKPPPEDQLTQAGFTLELTPGQRELIRKRFLHRRDHNHLERLTRDYSLRRH